MPKNLHVSDGALVLLRPRITSVLPSKYPHSILKIKDFFVSFWQEGSSSLFLSCCKAGLLPACYAQHYSKWGERHFQALTEPEQTAWQQLSVPCIPIYPGAESELPPPTERRQCGNDDKLFQRLQDELRPLALVQWRHNSNSNKVIYWSC